MYLDSKLLSLRIDRGRRTPHAPEQNWRHMSYSASPPRREADVRHGAIIIIIIIIIMIIIIIIVMMTISKHENMIMIITISINISNNNHHNNLSAYSNTNNTYII